MTQNASTEMGPWVRGALGFVLVGSTFVIVTAESLRGTHGSHLYGALLGLVIVGGTIDWLVRARSNPSGGFDPVVVMMLAVLLATPRFDTVATWLSELTSW
jgi:hypothetical protein